MSKEEKHNNRETSDKTQSTIGLDDGDRDELDGMFVDEGNTVNTLDTYGENIMHTTTVEDEQPPKKRGRMEEEHQHVQDSNNKTQATTKGGNVSNQDNRKSSMMNQEQVNQGSRYKGMLNRDNSMNQGNVYNGMIDQSGVIQGYVNNGVMQQGNNMNQGYINNGMINQNGPIQGYVNNGMMNNGMMQQGNNMNQGYVNNGMMNQGMYQGSINNGMMQQGYPILGYQQQLYQYPWQMMHGNSNVGMQNEVERKEDKTQVKQPTRKEASEKEQNGDSEYMKEEDKRKAAYAMAMEMDTEITNPTEGDILSLHPCKNAWKERRAAEKFKKSVEENLTRVDGWKKEQIRVSAASKYRIIKAAERDAEKRQSQVDMTLAYVLFKEMVVTTLWINNPKLDEAEVSKVLNGNINVTNNRNEEHTVPKRLETTPSLWGTVINKTSEALRDKEKEITKKTIEKKKEKGEEEKRATTDYKAPQRWGRGRGRGRGRM